MKILKMQNINSSTLKIKLLYNWIKKILLLLSIFLMTGCSSNGWTLQDQIDSIEKTLNFPNFKGYADDY